MSSDFRIALFIQCTAVGLIYRGQSGGGNLPPFSFFVCHSIATSTLPLPPKSGYSPLFYVKAWLFYFIGCVVCVLDDICCSVLCSAVCVVCVCVVCVCVVCVMCVCV